MNDAEETTFFIEITCQQSQKSCCKIKQERKVGTPEVGLEMTIASSEK